MDSYEATSMLFTKIKSIDPENASKIMGILLIHGIGDKDLIRLASSPHSVLLSLVLRAKTHLCFSSKFSSAPSSPSPLFNPNARPSNSNPFSQFSPRKPNNGFDFSQNRSSASSTNSWSPHGFQNNLISPIPCSLPSQMQPILVGNDGGGNAGVGPGLVNHPHLHRRSFSANDACVESEFESHCKFIHGGVADSAETSGEAFSDHREEIIRLKAAYEKRFGDSSQSMAGISPSHHNKDMNYLLQQQNEPHRASAGAVMMGEDFQKLGLQRNERIDFLSILEAYASIRIFLTFPADSTLKEEDALEYFSHFGPVLNVRIPNQQKRMFGFVTFLHSETVKLVLAKGKPHFICNARVLVKPYKLQGNFLKKRQLLQHMSQEIGEFSQSLRPSGLDFREPCDLNLCATLSPWGKMYDSPDMLLRRKLEEQERRLANMHLPDSRNHFHDQHNSLSSGSSLPTESHLYIDQISVGPSECNSQQLLEGVGHSPMDLWVEGNPLLTQSRISSKIVDRSKFLPVDINSNLEDVLPDSLFSSPKKPDSYRMDDLPETSACSSTFKSDTHESDRAPL